MRQYTADCCEVNLACERLLVVWHEAVGLQHGLLREGASVACMCTAFPWSDHLHLPIREPVTAQS